MTLEQALAQQPNQIAALTAVWMRAGARGFGFSENGRAVTCCGDAAESLSPSLTVPLGTGCLWVTGLDDDQSLARLESDAALLERTLTLENELDTLTGDLIESQDQLLALYELNKSLRGHLELDSLLAAIAQQASHLLNCAGAYSVFLDSAEAYHVFHASATRLPEQSIQILFKSVQGLKKPLIFNADESDELVPLRFKNAMCVPIRVHGQIQAALGWVGKPAGPFSSPDLKLGRAIAEHVGAEIENVLLYHETLAQARLKTELELARVIQARLIPQQIPPVRGLDMYARMKPALQVGGDFYDFVPSSDGRITVVLGDVSGKGMSAALVMAMLRTSLRTKARFLTETTPAEIFTRVTLDLYDDLTDLSMFGTTFVGTFDPLSSELQYANMGHAPVVYFPHYGNPELLEADSPPLGVLDVSMAENHTLSLMPGDLVVIATDGFTEACDESGELYSNARFMDLVASVRHSSAREIAEIVFETIAHYSDNRMDDDQTLVILKRV